MGEDFFEDSSPSAFRPIPWHTLHCPRKADPEKRLSARFSSFNTSRASKASAETGAKNNGRFPRDRLRREGLFKVDFVIIHGPRMGLGRIQPPILSIGNDGPGCFTFFQKADDDLTRIFVRFVFIPGFVFPVEGSAPGYSQTDGQGFAILIFGMVQVVVRVWRAFGISRISFEA